MIVKISLISQEMLPKSTLPKSPLSSFFSTRRDSLTFFDGTGKVSFKQIPSDGKICVVSRQRPNAMEMIRQDNHRIHPEGSPLFGILESQT